MMVLIHVHVADQTLILDGFSVRQRKPEASADSGAAATEDIQEKIAENMLLLAKNLKEQTQTANKIIRKDTEAVQASSKLTEKNFGSLKKESDKLQEHSKRAWKCWMWLMIGIVMAIFICEYNHRLGGSHITIITIIL